MWKCNFPGSNKSLVLMADSSCVSPSSTIVLRMLLKIVRSVLLPLSSRTRIFEVQYLGHDKKFHCHATIVTFSYNTIMAFNFCFARGTTFVLRAPSPHYFIFHGKSDSVTVIVWIFDVYNVSNILCIFYFTLFTYGQIFRFFVLSYIDVLQLVTVAAK